MLRTQILTKCDFFFFKHSTTVYFLKTSVESTYALHYISQMK